MQSGFIDVPIDDFNWSVRAVVDNLPGDLMAHDTRAGERDFSFHDMEVGMADTASFSFDEELAGLGPRHLKLLEREWAAGLPEDGAAHVAGPARHVVPRGGCGVGPRRCRGGEGAAEERTADPAEEGAGGGSGHGHGLGSTNSAAAVKQLLTTPSSLLLQVV